MRVFVDTEFTDFSDPRLISFGLVSERGDEFYAELSDGWQVQQCSRFVVDAVLPLLERQTACTLSQKDAGRKLADWLMALDQKVSLISDAAVDGQLINALLRACATPPGSVFHTQLLTWPGSAMACHFERLLTQSLAGNSMRHHALVDARALTHAVLQTEAEFRK
jgi:hypothetical protein